MFYMNVCREMFTAKLCDAKSILSSQFLIAG
jgi:hypothetical protein